jgi:hypothetical protein
MYRLIVSTIMGRYYTGDIEGKFWFAVQESTVGERFGCQESPSVINYSIDADSIDKVRDELAKIKKTIGPNEMSKFDKFFATNSAYNDEMMEEANLKVELLKEYADYGFGLKLLKCLETQGYCEFQAEL